MAFLDPGQPVRRWLLPIGGLYSVAVQLRLWSHRQGWLASSRLPCRVLSVGNLTVGGTGKTPVVILLAHWLHDQGQRVAVLSRGYKRSGRAQHLMVSEGHRLLTDANEAGDEPYLIARRCPHAVVAVGADRAALGRWVLEQCPIDCIILDDGFQHLSLVRDVDLVLLDATDAAGLEAMLPAGRLREPLSGLTRADGLVITRADSKPDVEAVLTRISSIRGPNSEPVEIVFRPEALVSVVGNDSVSLNDCRGKKAWLVSGIGNSGSFNRSAVQIGITVVGETVFRDHHRYGQEDVVRVNAQAQAAGADLVLTTEKDAGKLAPMAAAAPWWALRIRAEVLKGEQALRRLVCSPTIAGDHAHA
jgi:tetraacyldisaccharide 4'-kinase